MARKIDKRKPERRILILGEGQSEKQYFVEMKREEALHYKIEPELPRHQNYKNIFEEINEKAEDYKIVYCLIDLDYIIENGEYADYKQKKDRLMKTHKNVIIIESCPCTETWFVLHFEEFGRQFAFCDRLIKEKLDIDCRLKDYAKGDSSRNYYRLLKPYQQEAIDRAERVYIRRDRDISAGIFDIDCRLPFTEIYKVVKSLLDHDFRD